MSGLPVIVGGAAKDAVPSVIIGGADHKIYDAYVVVGGAAKLVHKAFDGYFSSSIPDFVGTTDYYDHGDYLYGEMSGHTTTIVNIGSRANVFYNIPVKSGDQATIVVSMNTGDSYSDNLIVLLNAEGDIITKWVGGTSAIDNREYTCDVTTDGILQIGVNIGTTSDINRWFKIFSITINGNKEY